MNLIRIVTNLRTAYIFVEGHERAALCAYHRAVGEVIYSVRRVSDWWMA
jgi:hypothetical protein